MGEKPERLWLLRHAETSAPAVFHGAESDVGLSDLGRAQAAAAAEWFRPFRPTAVVSSGMRRAADTAAPIAAACGVGHAVEPGLHERRVGVLSGSAFSASDGVWAETVRQWSAGNTAFTTPGAESFDAVAERVTQAWGRVVAAHPGGRVVVVAHGIVCKVLLLSLLDGWGPRRWSDLGRVANVAVTEWTPTDGGWIAADRLHVPGPVAALTDGSATEVAGGSVRSEA